jgi:hypothetical protein
LPIVCPGIFKPNAFRNNYLLNLKIRHQDEDIFIRPGWGLELSSSTKLMVGWH